MALPAKAKMAALVCKGRKRPKLSCGKPRFMDGSTSITASHKPTSVATTPQKAVAKTNLRTVASSYSNFSVCEDIGGSDRKTRASPSPARIRERKGSGEPPDSGSGAKAALRRNLRALACSDVETAW